MSAGAVDGRLPERLDTPRLLLRAPVRADAAMVNEAVLDSFEDLHAWMVWAAVRPSVADSRAFCEQAGRDRAAGSACPLLMLAADGRMVGATGFARVDWQVPAFEVGYWCRSGCTGQGYATEAAGVLTRFAFESLGARRVELRIDARNVRSVAVAERLGFELEGTLRRNVRDHHGVLRDTRIYALIDPHELIRRMAAGGPRRSAGPQPR